MKKLSFITTLLFFSSLVFAQSKTVYNAFKAGLSLRETPSAKAAVIFKIPYGEKLTLINPFNDTVQVVNEGLIGYWNLVEYKGKKGYVVGVYLLAIAPPKVTVKTMSDYFKQLSTPAGSAVTVKMGAQGNEMYSTYKKQLFKNGFEIHEAGFYESGYNTYFLPELTMQEGFIIARLIPEFKDAFSSADIFPTENKKTKVKHQGYDSEKEIIIQKNNGNSWSEKIIVNYEDGALYTFELFILNGQLVISFGGGV